MICHNCGCHLSKHNIGGGWCTGCNQCKLSRGQAMKPSWKLLQEASMVKGDEMKKGQFVEIQCAAGRGYVRQWKYQGTAKDPYTVSLRMSGDWQCGCPAWTRPKDGVREDCKHILHVQRDGLKQFSSTSITEAVAKPQPVVATGRKIR